MISLPSVRKGLKSLSIAGVTTMAMVAAAIAGIPFTEDFTSDALKDASTTADWDTSGAGTLRLGSAPALTGVSFTRTPLGNAGEATSYSRDIALGDIDGDGDLDAVVANRGADQDGQTNSIYLNNAGVFDIAPQQLGNDAADQFVSFGIAMGDLDNDGDLDVVSGNEGARNVYYLNDGSGNFPTVRDVAEQVADTWRVQLADVDGDSDLDIIESVSSASVRNFLYLNQYMENGGVVSFSEAVGIATDRFNSRSLALGDIDNDGDTDIVTGDQGTSNHIYRWQNGRFQVVGDAIVHNNTNTTFSVSLADVDGDGDVDLVEGNAGAATQIYLNNGSGSFSAPTTLADSNPLHVTVSLITRDVDRDGDIDIIEGNNGAWDHDGDAGPNETCLEPGASTPCIGQPVRLYLNNGNGTFANGIDSQPPTLQKVYGSAAGDINGDGLLDFVTAHSSRNANGPEALGNNAVYINGGTANGSSTMQLDSIAQSIDVNGDTDLSTARLDVAFTPAAAQTSLNWSLSNDGGNTFIPARPGVPVSFPSASSQLIWRVEMLANSPNAAQLPEIDSIDIVQNTRPNFSNQGDLVAEEGQNFDANISSYFSDDDGDTLTYQVSGLPAGTGLTLDAITGIFSGVPTNSDEAASPITLNLGAFDGGGFRRGNISLTVSNSVDDPPVAVDDGPFAIDEGGAIESTFRVLDNDTDPDTANVDLSAVLVTPPASSALFELKPDGTFDYTHDGSETTADSFTYRASDGANQSNEATVSISINPVNDAPVITLVGDSTISVAVGEMFTDPGAQADDAEDGDISADITVGGDTVDTATQGSYVITYDVTDSDGLAATQVTRTVNVATNEPPVITLNGPSTVTLRVGDTYTEQGATATDPEDGDISANIVIGGNVNTASQGTYTLTYNVTDSNGNAAAQVTRTVTVNKKKKSGGGSVGLVEFAGLMMLAGLFMFRRRRVAKLKA